MHRWYNKDINLTLDITTYCNAKCPQCSRTDNASGGLKRYSNIPLVHWDIELIKNVYTVDQLSNVRNITFSPSWGDPMMNPDGRDRFAKSLEQYRGTAPNYDDQSMLHTGDWVCVL